MCFVDIIKYCINNNSNNKINNKINNEENIGIDWKSIHKENYLISTNNPMNYFTSHHQMQNQMHHHQQS
jgi:hypothetical protein